MNAHKRCLPLLYATNRCLILSADASASLPFWFFHLQGFVAIICLAVGFGFCGPHFCSCNCPRMNAWKGGKNENTSKNKIGSGKTQVQRKWTSCFQFRSLLDWRTFASIHFPLTASIAFPLSFPWATGANCSFALSFLFFRGGAKKTTQNKSKFYGVYFVFRLRTPSTWLAFNWY